MTRRIPEYNLMAFKGALKSPFSKSLAVSFSNLLESRVKCLAAIPFLTLLSMASTLGQFSTNLSSLKKSPLPRVQVSVMFIRKIAQTIKEDRVFKI
jgi:enoyl-[acyl-carrier-protein] reductase (NADH)